MRVQVCIIGGGPSGLLLSQLLHLKGIDTIVLEQQSREYVLGRIRAGVLEHGFADLMREASAASAWTAKARSITASSSRMTAGSTASTSHKYSGGSSVVVYGQTELTRDLYDARDRAGARSSTTPRT